MDAKCGSERLVVESIGCEMAVRKVDDPYKRSDRGCKMRLPH